MVAAATDKFTKVGRSTATTLSSPGYTIGNTSINVASTTNYPTDTGVIVAIDEVDSNGVRISGTYNVFQGIISSATQISSLDYVGGDAERDYPSGATTRVYITVSSEQWNRMIDGITEEHNQDGTHGDVTATSVTATTVTTSGAVLTNPKVITGINDTNGNELVKVTATASAVNEITVANAATGNAPSLAATGTDTNIDVRIIPKGTGNVKRGASGGAIDWYEELGRTTLGSAGDTIAVTFSARKFLKILLFIQSVNTTYPRILINNDTTASYGYQYAAFINTTASAGTALAASGLDVQANNMGNGEVGYGSFEIYSPTASTSRLITGDWQHSAPAAANYDPAQKTYGHWSGTAAITSIQVVNTNTGDFAAGSELVVLGHD